MSPKKLQQALLARAKRKATAQQLKLEKLKHKSPLNLFERIFQRIATPIVNKYDYINQKGFDPKGVATSEMINEFSKSIERLEKQLRKSKTPNRRLLSSLLSSVPVIASVPLAYPRYERNVRESLSRLSEVSKRMAPEEAALLQSLLCIISLVSDPAPEEKSS